MARLVVWLLVAGMVLALLVVAWLSLPGTMTPWPPWDFVAMLVLAAMAAAAPLVVPVLAGLAAGVILGVADRRPG